MEKGTQMQERMFQMGERVRECRQMRGLSREELTGLIYDLPANQGKNRSAKQIGYIESGSRPLSSEYAELIAEALNVRSEYLQLKDNFKTEADKMEAQLDNAFKSSEIAHSLLSQLLSGRQYSLKYLKGDTKIKEGVWLGDDCYAVVENGLVVACLSLDEVTGLTREILYYTQYITDNLVESAKKRTVKPFKLPKEVL